MDEVDELPPWLEVPWPPPPAHLAKILQIGAWPTIRARARAVAKAFAPGVVADDRAALAAELAAADPDCEVWDRALYPPPP